MQSEVITTVSFEFLGILSQIAAYINICLLWLQGNLTMSDIGLAEKRIYHTALNGNISLPSVLHQKDD